ncbi:MAG TPA: POTRA domain-containing protein, partial [Chitinophagaceae bacterium]|nr:POTRA domain-containing protein [Chitinophagaceae bacterium]
MKQQARHILTVLCCCLYICSAAQKEISPADTALSPAILALADAVIGGAQDSTLILVGDITVHGNKKTKPYIIERELPFKQGEYIPKNELQKKMLQAQQQVTNTSLFTSVVVYIESIHNNIAFINVDVKERWYVFPLPYFKLADRNFNQWWVEQKASINRVNYGLKFIMNNVSGRNDKLNINLIAGYSRQIQLKYEQPFADKSLKNGYSVGFSYSNQRELNYNTDFSKQSFYKQQNFAIETIRGELAYLYRPGIFTRHSFRVGYTSSKVSDTILLLNPNYFPGKGVLKKISYPEFSYTIQYLKTDYNAYPSKGFIGDASIIRKGWNKEMNLTQLQATANFIFPLTPKTGVQLQAAGILKLPFDQPYINQQMFGYGGPYLRGLEYYVIDGVAGVMNRTTIR